MPADLTSAIEHAMTILSWQENLIADEMPPRWMWHLDAELELWFEEVEDKRNSNTGGSSASDDEWAPMMDNQLSPRAKKR